MVQGLIGTYKTSMYAKLNSNNYSVGVVADPATLTPATVYGDYLYDKPIDIAGIEITYGKRQGFGGGKLWVQRTTGVSDISDFNITMSAYDDVLDGHFKGLTPDATTVSTARIMGRNAAKSIFQNFSSLHHFEFDNSDGSPEWLTHCVLNAEYKRTSGFASGQGEGQNPNPLTYAATPNFLTRLPWGQLISANAQLTTIEDDKDVSISIISDWRYFRTAYIDNGVATTYTLPYLPASSTVGNHFVYRNGTAITPSGINTSTGVVTITAGSSGDVIVHMYPVGNTVTASA